MMINSKQPQRDYTGLCGALLDGKGDGNVKTAKKPPVQRGDMVSIDIHGLGHSGEGVGRLENYTIFVPGALPGETVSAKIQEVKKNYSKAKLVRIMAASPDRVGAPCANYEACGGCQLQHLRYESQLDKKRETVVAAIERIGKLDHVIIQPALAAENPWHYRNKMQLPIGRTEHNLVVGCYAMGSHEIVPIDNCLIQHELNNQIAAVLPTIMRELDLSAYDEVSHQGVLRYIMGRVGVATGEVMIVIVTATDKLPKQQQLVERIIEKIPAVTSIIHNVNQAQTNVMLGRKNHVIWGSDHITDRLGELVFQISPHSFFQVNTLQAQVLYGQALKYANLTGNETVIDAYCGTGTISLFLARQAKKVFGIEIVEQAISDAKGNAEANHITNAEFIAGDATKVMLKLYKQGVKPDVIVVDPPRAGCSANVLETFAAMQPKRIVYVSCSAASLARDLALLDELGYETKEIQPVDMFPQTFHVECCVLLQRKHSS